jgi:hypothetical protein
MANLEQIQFSVTFKFSMNNRIIIVLLTILNFSVFNSYSQENSSETESSYFLFPEFKQGIVLLKSGMKISTMLNYNSFTEKMIYEESGKMLAIKNIQDIDTIYIGDSKFLVLNDIFIEMKYHSSFDLFVAHKCKLKEIGKKAGYGGTSQTASITSYSNFSKDRKTHELEMPDGYEAKPYNSYLLKKNEEFITFTNFKQLSKTYRGKKDLLNEYINKNDIEFNNEKRMIPLIIYLETKN